MNYFKYYRNTLADADRKVIEVSTLPVKVASYFIETLPKEINTTLWRKESKDTETLNIVMAPCKFVFSYEHGKQQKEEAQEIFPFWIPAQIDREGKICLTEEKPFFVRDYLKPNPSNFYSISSIKEVDDRLKKHDFKTDSWAEYWKVCEAFFKSIAGKSFAEFNDTLDIELYIQPSDLRNLTFNILNLYDKIIELKPQIVLLDKITGKHNIPSIPLPSLDAIQKNSKHIGQMNGVFPLARSQREGVCAFTQLNRNDLLAVNGPPGTGKTTFLQSVVANLVVQSVLENKPPYLLVASSTNNQAITNILESFEFQASSALSNRWLPDVNSFGLYFSSKKSTKYQYLESVYGDGFFKDYESEDDQEKQSYFTTQFSDYFGVDNDIEDCKNHLQKELRTVKANLDNNIEIAYKYGNISQELKEAGFTNESEIQTAITSYSEQIIKLKAYEEKILLDEDKLKEAEKELSLVDKLFSSSQKAKENRAYKFERALFHSGLEGVTDWSNFKSLLNIIDRKILELKTEMKNLQANITKYETLAKEIYTTKLKYADVIAAWEKSNKGKLEKLYMATGKEYQNLSPIEDMNVRMDISLRYEMFWLAMHYREAEYLLLLADRKRELIAQPQRRERGREPYKKMLQRYSCLTPLFISTFHSLPKYSTYFAKPDGEQPYFELFDYLIVDEAGQVAPDVSIASFSLAKRAVVVGDVDQIEPVWSTTEDIDVFNLQSHHLLTTPFKDDEYETIKESGTLCSSGNLMKIAQRTCSFTNGKLRGVLLKEHRRCLDSIISYSNEFVYDKQLIPMKGNVHGQTHELPSKGYMHIPGASQKQGTSRINLFEAQVIAQWIHLNTAMLETDYKKSIETIIAVVTPYKSQAYLISSELRRIDKKYQGITVGTVHSLQGAEREIILLSTVLSKNDKLSFINSSYNMLNVATSRAKHSFLVFGNIDILNPQQNNPLGNLKKWLMQNENAELSNKFFYEKDEFFDKKATRISTLDKHIGTLRRAFEVAKKEIVVVSPFISVNAIKDDKIEDLIRERVAAGIKVTVITDTHLDVINGTLKPSSSAGRKLLQESGAKLLLYNGIHSKTLLVDDSILVEGSFNWLSAVRDPTSKYFRHETSIVLQNNDAKEKIGEIRKELKLEAF